VTEHCDVGNEKDGTPRAAQQHVSPRRIASRFAMAAVLVATFGAGIGAERYGLSDGSNAGASSSFTDLPAFETLQQTWDLIHSDYVDESAIDDEALIYGAAEGMVDSLGDTGHSTFLSPDQAKAWRDSTRGELIGIGIQVDFTSGRPVVISPLEGSPAEEAGVKPDDVITGVNGKSTEGMTQVDLFQELRGDEGTTVEVTFERPSEGRNFTVTLERRKIGIEPVSWTMLPGNVAYIRIAEFIVGTTDGVKAALTEAKAQGATSMVLDLRDNPGGLVFEAIGVASQFLPEGKAIYLYQEREGDPRPINTVGIGLGTDLPMAVLINKGSASAAEIVASALQENGRAESVGETTYGTGTVLSPIELKDGSMVVLGTALWLTADGDQLWHVGVAPTIPVDLPADAQVSRPSGLGNASVDQITSGDDTQLARAYAEVTK
jgi:carboxyl-terminal processing protease